MYYDYQNDIVKAAQEKAERDLDLNYNIIELDIGKNVNLSLWWERDESYDYYVDNLCGNIVLGHYDENYITKDTETIGNFRSHYFYHDGPDGNLLDMLDSADSIDGDLCLAIGAIKHSKRWKELYKYTAGILNIDRFYLKPEFRGKKYGYYIFPVLIDVLAKRKESLITIIPEPINDMARDLGREESMIKGTSEYRNALSQMQNFIKHFGFERIPKQQVWAAALMDEF